VDFELRVGLSGAAETVPDAPLATEVCLLRGFCVQHEGVGSDHEESLCRSHEAPSPPGHMT